MKRKSAYAISTNWTEGAGVCVLARSWRQALLEAVKWREQIAYYRYIPAERTGWGWRLTMGDSVICIQRRKR